MAELLEPQTREEQFLRAAATGDISQMPTPVTRTEIFLAFIAENGGGGGGGGGESTIAWRPSVSADGTISWTRTSSTTTPAPVNVKGEKGDTGATGEKGDNGYSPTITVTEITGGHRVTVTDASGSQSFDVMDGQGGQADSIDWSKVTNKPSDLVQDASYQHTDNNYTSTEKTKLAGLSNYDDTALSARVTANANAIADRYTKSETNAYVASQVTPKAEIEINESSNSMDIAGGGRYASFNVNDDGDMEMMLAEPGTYLKTATVPSKTNVNNAISTGVAEAKAYADGKTLAATGWGVARTGIATVTFNNNRWSTSATVDVRDLGFSSGADYDVVAQPTTGGTATPWGDAIAFINADKGASSFSVSAVTMEESLSGTVNVKYTIFAKGYGAVAYTGEIPTGGTTGQILTKRSDADGDYGWVTGGTHLEVGAEKWYGTYTENGVTYQVYSKLLDIGALPSAAGTTQYPHGITGIKQILQINGFTNDGFVMNAPRQNAQDSIAVYQAKKAGDIAIEVGKDRSSKNGFVMLIYAKNN